MWISCMLIIIQWRFSFLSPFVFTIVRSLSLLNSFVWKAFSCGSDIFCGWLKLLHLDSNVLVSFVHCDAVNHLKFLTFYSNINQINLWVTDAVILRRTVISPHAFHGGSHASLQRHHAAHEPDEVFSRRQDCKQRVDYFTCFAMWKRKIKL